MPRGGRRSGKPGKAYANRTDLNPGPQPVGNYASSGPYGTGVAMSNAQRAVPVSSPQAPGPSAPPPGAAGPGGAPNLAALLGASGPAPGELGDFARPSERPNEPITHGLPMGPGGGPEVLSNQAGRPALVLLQQLARQPYVSDEIRSLLNRMQG